MNSRTLSLAAMLAAFVGANGTLRGQVFTDPGFEDYEVSPGSYMQPTSGPWLFSNDAGVVEPFAPSMSFGTLSTWSATIAPAQGQQYVSTYAGGDSLRQWVSFDSGGNYEVSVYASAPWGFLNIPAVGALPLVGGEFTFTLDNQPIGNLQSVPTASSWTLSVAEFAIPAPGLYQLGIRNVAVGSYFINYDAFGIHAVPEPAMWQLAVVFGVAWIGLALLRRQRPRCVVETTSRSRIANPKRE